MNKNLKKNFIVDGSTHIDNFLTKKNKESLKNIIHDNFKNEISLPRSDRFNIEDINFHKKLIKFRKLKPKKFGNIYDRINLNSKFRSIFYSESSLKIFAKILGVRNNQVYVNGFMMRFDVPNDLRNKLNWHQDSPYYMMGYPKFNSGVCWCAITKNTKKNGTLKFIPGSHLKYIKSKKSKKNNLSSEQYKTTITKKEKEKIKNLDQKFGDAAFLHMNLKHRSGDNNSQKVRITIGCRFNDMSKSFNVGKELYNYNDKRIEKLL
jgi:ectoine hydroxylase-related dioxygenase (phytanoyl-CoA dioxygenase family)